MRCSKIMMTLAIAIMALVAGRALADFQSAADRLVDLQNDDGGWDGLDDGDPAAGTDRKTIAPISMGLAGAYGFTGDAGHESALTDAGVFLKNKTYFSPYDGIAAAEFDSVLGVSTHVTTVATNYYDALADGTYQRSDSTTYTTATYTQLSLDTRGNLAAWDMGTGLAGAQAVGANTSEWETKTNTALDSLDTSSVYGTMGLAGGLYGLAAVGTSDLGTDADQLAGYQLSSGAFPNASGATSGTVASTAYAVLALNAVDPNEYRDEIVDACDYLWDAQLATGGWENITISGFASGEQNEITGEALWALSDAYPTVVPEPASMLLFGTAIAAAMRVRKRRKTR